tara:strand:+ start:726 stop:983 length:258 start_codon:yes stop_codon:yes gene_type:complete
VAFLSQNPAINLSGRDEKVGRKYPIFLERILLLAVVVTFVLGYERVGEMTGEGIVSIFSTWCLFPFVLLFSAEMAGRVIQAINRD